MSGSYGSLNSKYNTLYALYLQLQTDISGGYTLQEVLDAGYTANDVPIHLITSTEQTQLSANNLTLIDTTAGGVFTSLNKSSLTCFNAVTGKTFTLNGDNLLMNDGSAYIQLAPTLLNFNGSQGTENQVLTKNASNNPEWADLPVSEIPDLAAVLNAGALASTTIDMDDFDLTNVANIITNTQTNLQGQFTFDTPPHIPAPILGNDAAPKGYVDSLVGQYAGGFNLFFNYSQTDVTYPTFKALSQLISSSAVEIVPTTIVTGNNLIAQFITQPLGIETIPVGLWDAFIYGAIDAVGGDAHYYFELWKKTASNVDSLLGTSGISPDINASPNNNPTSYSMVLPISTTIPLELTDRLYVIIYVSYNGSSSKELSTYFEGNYYSFLQTSLNAGTTLLSSNNTWTGTNAFSLPPTTPNQVGTPANTDIVNYETITNLISDNIPDITAVLTEGNTATNKQLNFNSTNQTGYTSAIDHYGTFFLNSNGGRTIDINIDHSAILMSNLLDSTQDKTRTNITSEEVDIRFRPRNAVTIDPEPFTNITKDRMLIDDGGINGDNKTTSVSPTGISIIEYDNSVITKQLQITTTNITINGDTGSVGQVLTKNASNVIEWEDTAVVYPIVSTLDYYITTDSPFFQYPPSPPTNALLQAYQYYGWYFINSVALRKIDWFFAPDYAMTVGDVLGVYLNYFNVTTTSNDNLPFFTIYTKPTGVNDYYPSFAHSSATYIANFTPTAATPFCSFMNITGTQPDPFPYGHQLGDMILSPVAPNPKGEYLPTEEVLAISVGTNSISSVNQVNFIMSKVGICLAQGNQELILNPQNIIAPASSWVGTATSNLNMSTFSIDASANNLSIGTLTSTGLTLGKSGATTNIQGNLQIAGQPGTSGQVLTSAGAGGVPTWTTISGTSPTLQTVLTNGNTAQGINLVINNAGSGTSTIAPTFITTTSATNNSIQLSQNTEDASVGSIGKLSPFTLQFTKSLSVLSTRYSVRGISTFNGQVFDITTIGAMTLQGVTPSTGQVLTADSSGKPTWATPTSGWTGTALSQLNMGIYDISGAVLDNNGGTLSLGANTTTTTIGKATTGITDLQGIVKINNSAGTSGQVLTSTGTSTAPTWQTPSASLAVVKTNPFLNTYAFSAGAQRIVYQNNFLNITPSSLTATYLIKAQLLCNNQGANTAMFGNLGIQSGGGAQTTSAISAFNGLAMSSGTNSTFSQTNSLSQCVLSTTTVYNQLSFTFIHTPATLTTLSYAMWVGTQGNGAGTIFSMEIIRIIA
jgi:hypothetical protein